MKGEKLILFAVVPLLIILLFIFSFFLPFFLPIFLFGMSLIIIFVFLFGIKGCFLSIVLVGLSIAFNYSKINGLSLDVIIFGAIVYLVLTLIISKLKNTNANLKSSEYQYKEVVERANDGIVIIQEGIIKYANPKIVDILGYSAKEVVGTDFKKYIAIWEAARVAEFYQKRIREEKVPSVYETALMHKSGGTVYVELSAGIIKYREKSADLVIIRDITQRKQAEDILHQREQEFKILVEEAPDIIARFDNEYRCIYINSAVEKEFGISPRSFFWKTFKEVGFPKKVSNLWEESIRHVFQNEKEKTIYLEQKTIKGLRYYYSRLLPEKDKDGKIRSVLSITRDITEAKEIDRIKSEFINLSSHQLRTPLSIIRWCSRALLEEGPSKIDEDQKGYIDKIYLASKKMIKLTNAFLNVAILDLGSLNISSGSVNFVEIIEEILSEFVDKLEEKELKIVKKYKTEMPLIKADSRLLAIVLRGLISNAVKYSYEKEKIFVEIKTDENNIIFKIGDNGYGIPEEQRSKVFTKFFRAENVKDAGDYGIGLDLYIIKSIIKNCEGEIWFESPNPELSEEDKKKGNGTMFYFTLPLKGISKKQGKKGLII